MNRTPNNQPDALFDSLEQRMLLSASLDADGILQITGTANDDAIVIEAGPDDASVKLTGVPGVQDGEVFTGVGQVRVRLFQGNDRAEVVGRLTTAAGKPMRVRLAGNAGDDTLIGGDTFDTIFGGAGNDIIRGGDLGDILIGGPGNDRVSGNRGRDTLKGLNGRDILRGDIGDDTVIGNNGDDNLFGGPGQDDLRGGFGGDDLRGNKGNDTLDGGVGDDNLFGDLGADMLIGDAGNDALQGGAGDDELHGGTGDDDLRGDKGNDSLDGGSDDDTLDGGDDNDTLRGETGDDELRGGSGDDDLDGGSGTDDLLGEDGKDRFHGHQGEWGDQSSDDDLFDDSPGSHRSLDDDFWSFINRLEINLGGTLPPEVVELVDAAQELNFLIGGELHAAREAIRDNISETIISTLIGLKKPYEGAGDAVVDTLKGIFGDDRTLTDFDLDGLDLDFGDLVTAYNTLRSLVPVQFAPAVDAAIDAINQHPAEVARLENAFNSLVSSQDQAFLDAVANAALSTDDDGGVDGGNGRALDDDFLSLIARLESNLGGVVPQQVTTLIDAARSLNALVRTEMKAARNVVRDNLTRDQIRNAIGSKKPYEGAGEAIAETLDSIFSDDPKLTDFDSDGARLDFDDVIQSYEVLAGLVPVNQAPTLVAAANALINNPTQTQAVENAFDALFTLDQNFLDALRDAVRSD